MEWEVWVERVPFDGCKRFLIQTPPVELAQLSHVTGVPVMFCLEEGALRVWPYPEQGWRVVAFHQGRCGSVPIKLLEDGPW